jgi:hypothetical protein
MTIFKTIWAVVSSKRPTRRFDLVRSRDLTGVSGTGTVASGVVFSDGSAELRWVVLAKLADGRRRAIDSVTLFRDWRDVALLHGHGGASRIVWEDTGDALSDTDILAQMKDTDETAVTFPTSKEHTYGKKI